MKLFLILIIYILGSTAQADIKDTARELLLNGERGKAYEVLINELSSSQKNKKEQSLKTELNNLSNLFLSDLGQKYFQQAQTLFYSGDSSYEQQLKKTRELEPENLKVIYTKAWFHLIEKKCSKSKSEFLKMTKLNIQYEGLARVDYYVKLCSGKIMAECGELKYNKGESVQQKMFKLVSCSLNKNNSKELESFCTQASVELSKIPEVNFWCSQNSDRAIVYKNKCKLVKKLEDKRELLEIYPFVCDEKISSQTLKN